MSVPGPTLAEVGEQRLVARLIELLAAPGAGVVRGPGDDAAVVEADGSRLVLTIDSQHRDVHYRDDWIGPGDLGRRALAINVSDLAAMGAMPRWALCALALDAGTRLEWVEALARGLRRAAGEFDCAVVGGDVTRVTDRCAVTIAAVGLLPAGVEAIGRDGAAAGDECWVTGRPGRAAAGRVLLGGGWRLAEHGPAVPAGERPGDRRHDDAVACLVAWTRPSPAVRLGPVVAAERLAHAMIDLSDGLAIDALRVCAASGVGLTLEGDRLAEDPVLQRWQEAGLGSALDWVLGGGDDYQLLCAVPPPAAPAFATAADEAGIEARRIGRFEAPDAGARIRVGDELRTLDAAGWDHFTPDGP